MPDVIVDSCVAAKWALPESDSPKAIQLVTDSVQSGSRLLVLDIVFAEVGNAIWKQLMRGTISLQTAHQSLLDFNTSPIYVEESRRRIQPALAIAAKYRRSFYDSLFVALVADLQLPGVTSDEPLHRAVHSDFPNVILLRDW
jgi:predicted nucleic acid-binding protein